MSYSALLIHTIEVTTPVEVDSDTPTDRYGNAEPATETVTERAFVQDQANSETVIDRDTRVSNFLVFLTKDTAVTGLSTLTWLGRSLRVQGEPKPFYRGLGGALHHWECEAREVRG